MESSGLSFDIHSGGLYFTPFSEFDLSSFCPTSFIGSRRRSNGNAKETDPPNPWATQLEVRIDCHIKMERKAENLEHHI